MTVDTPTATTACYSVTIPIYSCVTVFIEDAPTGLTDEEVLARVTADDLDGVMVYPEKSKEVTFEALETIESRSNEITIEES